MDITISLFVAYKLHNACHNEYSLYYICTADVVPLCNLVITTMLLQLYIQCVHTQKYLPQPKVHS